jgi:cytochrome c553
VRRVDIDPRSALLTIAALAAAGVVAAVAVVGLGLYDTSARDGHWPGVSWVLHTTFRHSVALRAPSEDAVPELTDAMASLGAGHFDAACADCHAAPGRERPATMRAMTPEPPHIEEAVADWSAGEFHWIVHEGVKMSGMPGWPSERSGEVWPVVAFLTRVQDGMSGEEYDELSGMPAAAPRDFSYCSACHGERGATNNPHIPRLDILSEAYIAQSLDAYASGGRDSGIMEHAVTEIPSARLPEVAARFAAFGAGNAPDTANKGTPAGRALAYAEESTRVPACRACHGPWPDPINEAFPSLAGQNADYLETQLKLWREGARGGGNAAELMHEAARALSDADIEALTDYYSALRPARLNEVRETD